MPSVGGAPLFWKINTSWGRKRRVVESKYTATIWFVWTAVVIKQTIKLRFCGKFVFTKNLTETNKQKKNHWTGTSLSSRWRVTAPVRRADRYVDLSEHAERHRLIGRFHQHGPLQDAGLGSEPENLTPQHEVWRPVAFSHFHTISHLDYFIRIYFGNQPYLSCSWCRMLVPGREHHSTGVLVTGPVQVRV